MSDLVLTHPQPDSMLTMIERVIMAPEFDVAKLQTMLELRERWEANEAKKAYVAAKARFAALDIKITRDKTNKQYDSHYTSIGNLVDTVRPKLALCGLEARWKIEQDPANENIKVICILTHECGHSESVSMTVPPDKSGSKNTIQQIKAAITYARNLTFEAVCGLASRDPSVNVDDDGNSASNGDLNEQIEWIQNAKDPKELDDLFRQAFQKFKGNPNAQKSVIEAKDKKRRDFR